MRRWIVFILLLLVLGALTTASVAWLFAGFAHPIGVESRWSPWTTNLRSQSDGWAVTEWMGPGKRARVLMTLVHHPWHTGKDPFDLPAWSAGHIPADPTTSQTIYEDARGWPWHVLRCTWSPHDHAFADVRERVRGGIVIRPLDPEWLYESPVTSNRLQKWSGYESYVETHLALPLIPIWDAFALSTLAYAVTWGALILLLSLPRFVFAHLRRLRRRCAVCGYQVHAADSDVCSECGYPKHGWLPIVTATHARIVMSLILGLGAMTSAFATVLRVRFEPPPAIHEAAATNDVTTLLKLVRSGVSPDTRHDTRDLIYDWQTQSTPLMWAAARGHLDAIDVLLEAGANINAINAETVAQTALGNAVRAGENEAAIYLLEHGADPRLAEGLLQSAVISGEVELLRLVLRALEDADADLEQWRSNAVVMAAHEESLPMVDELLRAGVDNDGLSSAMAIAITSRADDLVQLLLQFADDVPQATRDRWLRAAVEEQRPEIARQLIESGADPNHRTIYRSTLMHDAVRAGNITVVRTLVELGGDPNILDGRGESLLFAVWWFQDLTILDQLLAWGVDVNHRNNRGMTVLHEPVHFRRIEGVRPLLDSGADPMIPDNDGITPLRRAREVISWGTREPPAPDPEIVELLEQAVRGR